MTEHSQDPVRPRRRYGALADFYTADPRRIQSRETDVGLWWREGADGPLHRAAWVKDTGELYLVRLGPVEDGGGGVEVLAVVQDADLFERVLYGWREECGRPNSLAWLRERVPRLSERVRSARVKAGAAVAAGGTMLAAVTAVVAMELG